MIAILRKLAASGAAPIAGAILLAAPFSDANAQLDRATVGAWSVRAVFKSDTFSHCVMTSSTAGSHQLIFAVARAVFSIGIVGYGWDAPSGTPVQAYYQVDDGVRIPASGLVAGGGLMLLNLRPQRQAFDTFRTASTVRLAVTGAREHAFYFSIPGSAAAFDRLYACGQAGIQSARNEPPAHERQSQRAPDSSKQAESPSNQTRRPARPAAPPGSGDAPPRARHAPPATPRPPNPPDKARAPDTPERPPAKPAEPRRIGSATGFYVSLDGHLLTAAHVVRRCKSIRAQVIGDRSVAAAVIAKSESDDLALLKAEAKPTNAVPIRAGSLRLGEQIVVFGFPFSDALASTGNLTTGNVTALAGVRDDHSRMQISAPVQPGNSGGPVLDLRGRVAGVLVSGMSLEFARYTGWLPQNINFAVKSSLALSFLEAHGVSVKPEGAIDDLSVADVAERARGFTARIDCFE